ncbi:MAG: hypothetical protein WC488_02735 [Candidatus Micrarchaeia archaeon]
MKAQISVELLFNFLFMLILVSAILAAFSTLSSEAKAHGARVLEKAKIEGFARTLDKSEIIHQDRFAISGNYSIGDISAEGALVGESEGGKVFGYTIYGIGGSDGEPV